MKLILENSDYYLEFNRHKAIELEVKLNLTDKGKEYRHIGDALYYDKDIFVTHSQFYYLRDLAYKHTIMFTKS